MGVQRLRVMALIVIMIYKYVASPLGQLLFAAKNNALVGLWIEGQRRYPTITSEWVQRDDEPIFEKVEKVLQNYFNGQGIPDKFDFDIEFIFGTPFKREVWQEVKKLKCGQKCSYKDLAERVDNPGAVRAVASAVGCNPISILIGCHRVVNSNGGLGGYAAGVQKKKQVLSYQKLF